MASLQKQVADRIDPAMMIWVIDDSLDHKGIIKLCNACALSYDGTRTKSLPTPKLVMDLSNEFYENETNARTIVRALTRANSSLIKTVSKLSPEEVENFLQDEAGQVDEGRIGRLLFALACDARPDVYGLIDRLSEDLLMMEGKEEALEEDESGDRRSRDGGVGDPRLSELDKEKEELAHAQKRLDELMYERKVLQGRIKEMQHDMNASHKANKTLAEEKEALQRRLDKLSSQEVREDLASAVHQLTRESRKTQHDLEGFLSNGTGQGPTPFLEAVGESIEQVKGLLNNMALRREEEQAELKQRFDDLGREMHTLRVEAKRLQEPGVRAVKSYGETARVGVFVDVQNVFYAARQFNARVDFEKLLEATVGKRRLIKAIAYVIQSPEVDQTSFVSMLQQKSYEVKRKDLRLRSDGSAKGDWDMGMAIDIIGLADKLDVVVIVSGDGDFVALAHLIKTMGPKVEVFSFVHNTARDLIQAADSYYPIEEGLLLMMNSSGNRNSKTSAEPEE